MIFEVNTPRNYEPGPPERDPEYLKFIRAIGWCLACGRRGHSGSLRGNCRAGRVEAMHTGPHGISQKSSDYSALPGCRECHRELHRIGPVAFQEKWGINFREHIQVLNERYRKIREKRAA